MADYKDNYIQFQVKLENLKEGEAREIVNFLDDVQQDLLIKLEGSTTDWSRARYADMISTYEQALDEVFTKGIMPKLEADGLEFTARTQTAHVQMLKKAIGKKAIINTEPEVQTGAAVVNTNLSPAAIYTAATTEPMQGKLMKEWATQLSRKDKAQISAALRQSWIEGEAISKAAKRIRPILLQTRRDLAAITRTYYGHLAAQTRDIVWKNNDHLVEGIIWDSILDGRTTINICAPRDQLKYTLNGEPIGHNLDYHGGPGQAHWQCRSMSMPLVKGVVRRVERQTVGAGKNYKRGDNTTRTGRVRTNSAYNRDKGILKESTMKPGQTYSDWLKKQPKAFQEDVLGVEKADAFRKGKWKLGERFVAQNPTTLRGFNP